MAQKDWVRLTSNLWVNHRKLAKVQIRPPHQSKGNNYVVGLITRKTIKARKFKTREQAVKFALAYMRKN